MPRREYAPPDGTHAHLRRRRRNAQRPAAAATRAHDARRRRYRRRRLLQRAPPTGTCRSRSREKAAADGNTHTHTNMPCIASSITHTFARVGNRMMAGGRKPFRTLLHRSTRLLLQPLSLHFSATTATNTVWVFHPTG